MEENYSNPQAFEFEILGIKGKWKATIFFGMMALSILLNVYLVYTVVNVKDKLYERVITEIKEPMRNINQNIQQTNDRLNKVEEKEENNNE